jgi:hypothetical protein
MRRITRDDARRAFTFALESLGHIDRSPLKRLREEFQPEWRCSFSNPESRYIGIAQREQMEKEARAAIVRWAAACKLVAESDSRPSPEWLVDYAIQHLKKLRDDGQVTAPTLESGTSPSGNAPSPVDRRVVLLPVPNVEPHESWLKYKKRACATLHRYWVAMSKQPKTSRGPRRQKRQPSKTRILDHAQWFILYQCCGWHLAQIGDCHWYDLKRDRGSVKGQGPEQTIWQGIRSIAERTGLRRLPKRPGLKKSAP